MKEGRVIIVTGASSGIGRALAERAVRAGFRVMAVGRRAERLAELERVVHAATGSVETLALDIRTPGAPARIVRETLQRLGRIDVLINNAGGVAVGPIAEQSDEALREQFETHVMVPLALTREALGELRRTRGHVFFVGSGVARVPVGGLGAYPPAKAAVRNMVRVVRGELRRDGIAVTYVDPGAVATEFMTRAGFSGPPRAIAAQPHDVARKILAAVDRRPNVVNAVPWQTTLVALAEAFPAATDMILARLPQIVGTAGTAPAIAAVEPAAAPLPAPPPAALPASAAAPAPMPPLPTLPSFGPREHNAGAGVEERPPVETRSPFDDAIEPMAARMRKFNLSSAFVAGLLSAPGRTLEVGDVSMRWAGMPNKHERALTYEVLEVLADAGFVTRNGNERYIVAKSADSTA